MLQFINKDQVLGLVRHVVTFFGGVLVARGKLEPGAVETIAGVVVTIVGAIFSFMSPEKKIETTTVTESRTIEAPRDKA